MSTLREAAVAGGPWRRLPFSQTRVRTRTGKFRVLSGWPSLVGSLDRAAPILRACPDFRRHYGRFHFPRRRGFRRLPVRRGQARSGLWLNSGACRRRAGCLFTNPAMLLFRHIGKSEHQAGTRGRTEVTASHCGEPSLGRAPPPDGTRPLPTERDPSRRNATPPDGTRPLPTERTTPPDGTRPLPTERDPSRDDPRRKHPPDELPCRLDPTLPHAPIAVPRRRPHRGPRRRASVAVALSS